MFWKIKTLTLEISTIEEEKRILRIDITPQKRTGKEATKGISSLKNSGEVEV